MYTKLLNYLIGNSLVQNIWEKKKKLIELKERAIMLFVWDGKGRDEGHQNHSNRVGTSVNQTKSS